MDKAKAAIRDFTSKAGHHDTTVHEHVAPAVVNEKITPTRHEEAQTVVDREVHQEHHHTTIQPIRDQEILPEQHSHNIVGTETKEYNHGDSAQIRERLAREAAQFKNTSETADTRHSQSVAETVGGEHVHHHVHENIQPVVQKETIQPSVVHTVVPVHEVHNREAKHHSASALPAVSLADFKAQGGTLQGRDDRIDRFDGEPRTETTSQHSHHGGSHQHGLGSGMTGSNQQTTSGPHGNTGNKLDPRVDSDRDGSRTVGGTNTNTSTGYDNNQSGSGIGSGMTGSNQQTTSGPHGNTGNKLDPRVDSDRDGSRTVGGTNTNTTTGTSSGYGNNQSGSGIGSQSSNSGLGREGYTGRSNAQSANQVGGMGTGDSSYDDVQTQKKPSLMDKLNPMKDANHDGQKGFMK